MSKGRGEHTFLLAQPHPMPRHIQHIPHILPDLTPLHTPTLPPPSIQHAPKPRINPRHKHHIRDSISQHRHTKWSHLKHLITPPMFRRKRKFPTFRDALHSVKFVIIQRRLKKLLSPPPFMLLSPVSLHTKQQWADNTPPANATPQHTSPTQQSTPSSPSQPPYTANHVRPPTSHHRSRTARSNHS